MRPDLLHLRMWVRLLQDRATCLYRYPAASMNHGTGNRFHKRCCQQSRSSARRWRWCRCIPQGSLRYKFPGLYTAWQWQRTPSKYLPHSGQYTRRVLCMCSPRDRDTCLQTRSRDHRNIPEAQMILEACTYMYPVQYTSHPSDRAFHIPPVSYSIRESVQSQA